jgi:hypothetical protein
MEQLWHDLWLCLVLAALFWLPGQALLVLHGSEQRWPGLQQPIVAFGLSVSLYPVLFYALRFWAPAVQLTPWLLWVLLLFCAVVLVVQQRRRNATGKSWQSLEWVAVVIVAATLLTRLWLAEEMPYPAWTDSLHHVLLTELTAATGRLPTDLSPYFPVDVKMYHLGLYALSASVEWLAQVQAHTAVLWVAQVLNGLCGLGVYLVLDRYSSRGLDRLGALVGAAVVGLFSFQPAFYVNWGRFTQVASQAILLIALVVTLETLKEFAQDWAMPSAKGSRRRLIGQALLCALLNAAVFLLHFRVAAFYGPALLLGLLGVGWHYRLQWRALLSASLWISGFTLLLILPTLWTAVQSYIESLAYAAVVTALDPVARSESLQQYYEFPWSSYTSLAAPTWLWALCGVAALVGLLRRNPVTLFSLGWMALLLLEGYAYLFGIAALMVTNLGAILILFYLPIGLIIGAGVDESINLMPLHWQKRMIPAAVVVLLLAAIPAARLRIQQVEPYRFFVTDADVRAMRWLDEHLPPDARIAVNTVFWLPTVPHGTDAGYWLPYFTGRNTTAGVMIMHGDYLRQVAGWSHTVVALESDLSALHTLYDQGIKYIYIGARGDFASPGLQVDFLRRSPEVRVLYERDGVAILQIVPLSR